MQTCEFIRKNYELYYLSSQLDPVFDANYSLQFFIYSFTFSPVVSFLNVI